MPIVARWARGINCHHNSLTPVGTGRCAVTTLAVRIAFAHIQEV
jgi:hypothetical protein